MRCCLKLMPSEERSLVSENGPVEARGRISWPVNYVGDDLVLLSHESPLPIALITEEHWKTRGKTKNGKGRRELKIKRERE